MKKYLPEGKLFDTAGNKNYLKNEQSLAEAYAHGAILEAQAVICDSDHNLIVDLLRAGYNTENRRRYRYCGRNYEGHCAAFKGQQACLL